MALTVIYYDTVDPLGALLGPERSVFLAGPTARGGQRTVWRIEALGLLERAGFDGVVIVPEFVSGIWREERWREPFEVMKWETTGIDYSDRAMFWMPFSEALPGLTTRSEVAREMERMPGRIDLGMPPETRGVGHIRYHAQRNGIQIHDTLAETADAAMRALP